MWFLIVLAALGALLLLPIQLVAAYDEKGGRVYIRYGLLVLHLYPADKKTDGKEKKRQKASSARASGGFGAGKPDTWSGFLRVLKKSFEPICEFRRQLRVDYLYLKVILAKEDPCDLGVFYGRAWAAISDLQARLNRLFKIKKQNIDLLCDYTADQTLILARTRVSITCIRFLMILLRYGAGIINEYRVIKNENKGGNTNEQETS